MGPPKVACNLLNQRKLFQIVWPCLLFGLGNKHFFRPVYFTTRSVFLKGGCLAFVGWRIDFCGLVVFFVGIIVLSFLFKGLVRNKQSHVLRWCQNPAAFVIFPHTWSQIRWTATMKSFPRTNQILEQLLEVRQSLQNPIRRILWRKRHFDHPLYSGPVQI